MGILLNTLAVHHSHAFRDLKKEHPVQVNLFVGQNNSGEMVMHISKQTAFLQKNTEQNAHYLLTIITGEQKEQQANGQHQKNSEQNARYLLTIMTRTRYRHSSCEI